MVMQRLITYCMVAAGVFFLSAKSLESGEAHTGLKAEFHTSDRCMACHNELTTPSGKDVSIGLDWRASIMANSSRDPYWQASVRRESVDHPEATADIEDECSVCHMPITRYEARVNGKKGRVFDYLPFSAHSKDSGAAEDGVSCSVCHQISNNKLGTRDSFNGQFVIDARTGKDEHREYGPFVISGGHQTIMNSSTGGFRPTFAEHIRDSALCGSCHQLYTTARGAGGKEIGSLPEQMPYLEWLHSDYPKKYSCQACHMPQVHEMVPITSVLGQPRSGLHEHVFVGGNFLLQSMLNRYRAELSVSALPQELTRAAEGTLQFLQTQSARISIRNVALTSGQLRAEVLVENLTGHKLPTAYPSRRAWLHFLVRDGEGKTVFESGALNPDGSIKGNDNDSNREAYEPHYREITSPDQVEIFEPILKDSNEHVTTGLLAAVGYLKDNRLLPSGFDKSTAEKDIAVVGDAADDPNFAAGNALEIYSVPIGRARGPFHIEVELAYEPIGYRWAHNLEPYSARETQRFVGYYSAMSSSAAAVLARAQATY
jgi:hypothetical protein